MNRPAKLTAPGPATRQAQGYTLIELLVVIAIIAILIAILLPAVPECAPNCDDRAAIEVGERNADVQQWIERTNALLLSLQPQAKAAERKLEAARDKGATVATTWLLDLKTGVARSEREVGERPESP